MKIVNDHERVEMHIGIAWQCKKCGFLVMPSFEGHRCWKRSEMYTEKPKDENS